ncbi:MAG TPA: valine--tRNA ligase, partial [Candidatus Omnitrophota bacterium]|nr:valine--tRNA ligase [Candidatus Omnitrophota bacterium]
QTALADEEAPHHDLKGNLYYLKYPYKDDPDDFVVVATTRPETMLGDTAVAVNPKDRRYKKSIGRKLVLPLVNREIEVIADESVDMKFGTGAVKITPAHDPNDYVTGKKHDLEFVNIFHPDARINENGGEYKDMDRFEAREVIIEDLKEQGFLEKIEPHDLSAGHCYRCHTIIEPYLSKQWFVKMQPLSVPATAAVKTGRIKFHPDRWTKVYLNWMENIQDWCISRQIWWGHRIPVYYCADCREKGKAGVHVSRTTVQKCPECGSSRVTQDNDVLDTWFSSWLWPFATFGWPKETRTDNAGTVHNVAEDLGYFYPTSALSTASEIIFFWVARMIMAGFEFMADIPFKDVYIHGTVRDIEGRKMSKSLGNIIDPLEIIKEYGTDALRFSLISITSQGQDVYLSKERFEQGRNFANKMWNASRFVLMNLEPSAAKTDLCVFFKKEDLSLPNRWILSRFYSTLKELDTYLNSYRFNEAANLLYHFFWHEFCDWYLEIIKPDIKDPRNQVVMYKILEKYMRAMHPFMPFITEEIWHYLAPEAGSIMDQPWPHVQGQIIDKKVEKQFDTAVNVITAIRNMRSELEIAPAQAVEAVIANTSRQSRDLLTGIAPHITFLARLSRLAIQEKQQHHPSSVTTVVGDSHISILLEGIVDIDKEKKKLDAKISRAQADIKAKENMLANKAFVERAKPEVVENERTKLSQLKETLTKLQGVKHALR